MTAALLAIIAQYSLMYNVEPRLVVAIVQAESAFNEKAVGKAGEIGLMQLMPEFFPGYTEEQLYQPEINIRLGVEHLAKSMRECRHKLDNTWIVCYNLGVKGGSKVRHPKKWKYYKRVMSAYAKVPARTRKLAERSM